MAELKEILLHHVMNEEEQNIWLKLSGRVLKDCEKMKLLAEDQKTVLEALSIRIPGEYQRGYHHVHGYYELAEDSGKYYLDLVSSDEEEVRFYFLEKICDRVGFRKEFAKRETFRKEWHYTDSFDPVRGVWLENKGNDWKYDLRYDGRKYWFEETIRLLAVVYPLEESPRLRNYIRTAAALLNRHFEKPRWGFDIVDMEFVEISKAKEKDD